MTILKTIHLPTRFGQLKHQKKCIILLIAFWGCVSSSAWCFRSDWDADFKLATETYLPLGYDWRMLKAQCYQESLLQPLAMSPVGAYGLCQFMPRTAADVGKRLGSTPDEFWLPEISIRAAGYYMGILMRSWKAERPFLDRIKLAQASYNAGIGNVLKAQNYCDKARLYDEIIPCLPRVTGRRNSRETIGYVDYIVNRWYPRMLLE